MVVAYKNGKDRVFSECLNVTLVDKGTFKGTDVVVTFHNGQTFTVHVGDNDAKRLHAEMLGGATTIKLYRFQ